MTAPSPYASIPPGSQHYYAGLFLPPQRREAWAVFLHFCREIAATTQSVSDHGVAQSKLNWWRQQVSQLSDPGRTAPEHPLLQHWLPHAQAHQVTHQHLLQVIDGYQMDLDQSRYLDFAQLQPYCQKVGGIPAEAAARFFGQTDEATSRHARQLGLSLELTRMLQCLGEDAMRGRIYIPINELQEFDVKAHELVKRGQSSDHSFKHRFEGLMRFQLQRARQACDEAIDLLPLADRRSQKPALMLAAMNRALLNELAADPGLVLTNRISLTPLRMLWIAWKVQALGRL